MNKKITAAIAVLAMVISSPILQAGEGAGSTSSPQVVGEWEFKSQWPERTSSATMTITKNAEGKYEGTWSSQWGESALSDITFEDGKLKFVQTSNFGGQEMKTTYEGTVADGKVNGKAKGEWGDLVFDGTLEGETKADIAGKWQMSITMPAREIIEKLTITENADGTLAGKWEAQRGENTISNVKFEGGKLTFTRVSKFRNWDVTMLFTGTVDGDNMKGIFSSERGDREVNATRLTAGEK
ncbi:MAG: hypothetical protein JW947_08400 [Sedimentisphaerales bacterium]|nr:hypothetical protein [Sedimentisphaerales bacterium]